MKIIFNKTYLVLFALLSLAINACVEPDDLVTADAKTGGLVEPTALIPYKLGLTPDFDIEIAIPKGAAIQSIEVAKQYFRSSDEVYSNTVTSTIDVGGANASGEVVEVMNYDWASLIDGIVMPSEPQIPNSDLDPTIADFIGDNWTFSYTATLSDGRKVINNATTNVAVANFFAGTYDDELLYFHPSAGGSYPTEAYGGVRKSKKDLIPTSPFTCKTFFAVWQDNYVFITIDADNNVTLTFDRDDAVSGDPHDPSKKNSYDPETGVIQIYYYYNGSAGTDPNNPTSRIFWETFIP